MKRPLVVVVTGPPAAGKTTIAREVAARLRLPLITKDTIKEALFDGLGTADLAWYRGLRYPRLEKVGKGPSTLDALLAPR